MYIQAMGKYILANLFSYPFYNIHFSVFEVDSLLFTYENFILISTNIFTSVVSNMNALRLFAMTVYQRFGVTTTNSVLVNTKPYLPSYYLLLTVDIAVLKQLKYINKRIKNIQMYLLLDSLGPYFSNHACTSSPIRLAGGEAGLQLIQHAG